jgi:hypothetical protein
MTDEEILQKMRERVNKSIAYAMESSGDAWMHTLGDMAQIFLQLQMIDRLTDIDTNLNNIYSILDSIDQTLIKVRNGQ